MLHGKNILIGVSGSIAAYKAALLTRLLIKAGANVKVVMSPSAKDFITPLTLATLSKNPVHSDLFRAGDGTWTNHVDLGLWADAFVIAPATANTLAKMANGICDNLLLAVYLSARCRVYMAPAMDLDMYKHTATKANIKKLAGANVKLINPGTGELASGLEGEGRMAEPEEILAFLENDLGSPLPLKGKKALVTAGPTYEAIDPVRFIGNHSSGKMGFALAEELAVQGAAVTLVCGPNGLQLKNKSIKRIDVVSAEEMYKASVGAFKTSDIAVLAAAVADFKPAKPAKHKIKKSSSVKGIDLVATHDIAFELGKLKKKGQFIAGFALETENDLANAKEKLKKKNFDLVVLNNPHDKGAGFGHDTNRIKIVDTNNKTLKFELKNKGEVAKDIVAVIIGKIK
jgi:phosphopantothenoylcysteine decarboxylase/phosphopantothenate--cysteine ligase